MLKPTQLLIALTLALTPLFPGASAQSSTAVVELSNRPIIRENLGLRLYLPVGAEAQTYELGDRSSLAIRLPQNLGVINIQDSPAAEQATLSSMADSIIRNRLNIDDTRQLPRPGQRMGRGALLIRDTNLTLGQVGGPKHPAERIYLAVEDSPGSAAIMGYTVFKPGPHRALTFELITNQQGYARAREMYELTVASATIEDPGELAEARRMGVELATRWLRDVNEQRLEQAVRSVGSEWRWERLFQPSLSGGGDDAAEEIGYRRIRAWKGRRGEVSRADNARRGGVEQQEGFLVRVESRTLYRNSVIDTAAVFFLSLNKQDEAWSIEMAMRDQSTGSIQRSAEYGVRSGTDMAVSTRIGEQPLSTTKPQILGDAYLSRVEAYLLPFLLAQTELPAEYRFYAFQSQTGRVSMRSDVLERSTSAPAAWTLTTRLSQDDELQVSTLGADGSLISTKLDDGSIWQPIELARLGRLWRTKRLPMD